MNPEHNIDYVFGEFRLNLNEHCLQKGDEVYYLRPKTFETLLLLIQKSGHLVSKQEILDKIWADSIVTESTLTQSIKEIRKILNDDPANPQFLKTIPRVGYKFIAPVKRVNSETGSSPKDRAQLLSQSGSSETILSPLKYFLQRTKMAGLLYVVVAGFIIILLGYFIRMYVQKSIPFSEREWVLVTDFTNFTGEEVFESALKTALEIELNRSRFINTVSMGRIFDNLRLMKQSPDEKITEDLGLKICKRDGNIKILLSGKIEEIGGMYSISVRIINPFNEKVLDIIKEDARSREDVLPAMEKLARRVRSKLGETLPVISVSDTNLARVTTSSLKALSLYSQAWKYANLYSWNKAKIVLQQALKLDSSFAMAHLVLAYSYLWMEQPEQARIHFQLAKNYSETATLREKYFILGSYAYYNMGDLQKARDYFELLVQFYPDDYWGHQNLSLIYHLLGNGDGWNHHKKECLRIRPNNPVTHSDLGMYALFVEGNISVARKEFDKVLELSPNFPMDMVQLSPAFFYWLEEKPDSAKQVISTFLDKKITFLLPEFQVTAYWFISRFYLYLGDFYNALRWINISMEGAARLRDQNILHWCNIEKALLYLEMGERERFFSLLSETEKNSTGLIRIEALGWMAIERVKAGQKKKAMVLLQKLYQESSVVPPDIFHPPVLKELNRAKLAFKTHISGEIALIDGDTSKAVTLFSQVTRIATPKYLPSLNTFNPGLYFVASWNLINIYQSQGKETLVRKTYEDVLKHKPLIIITTAAAGIWNRIKNLYGSQKEINKGKF